MAPSTPSEKRKRGIAQSISAFRTGFFRGSWLSPSMRGLPLIIGVQIVFFAVVLIDPLSLKSPASMQPRFPPPKKLLSIDDVEQLTAQVAVNGTVIFGVCAPGYVDFFKNWAESLRISGLGGKFLVLAGDEDTFLEIHAMYPYQAVLRMDVKEPPSILPELNVMRASKGTRTSTAALELAYRKVIYAREIMNGGHNVIVSSVTTVWSASPLPYFKDNDVFVTLFESIDPQEMLVSFPEDSSTRLLPVPPGNAKARLPGLSDEFVYLQNNVGSWVTVDYWAVVLDVRLEKERRRLEELKASTGALQAEQAKEEEDEKEESAADARSGDSKAGQDTVESKDRARNLEEEQRTAQSPKVPKLLRMGDLNMVPVARSAFHEAVKNVLELSPRPRIAVLPPAQFPPPAVFFSDGSWRTVVFNNSVVVCSLQGVRDIVHMRNRLKHVKLWRVSSS